MPDRSKPALTIEAAKLIEGLTADHISEAEFIGENGGYFVLAIAHGFGAEVLKEALNACERLKELRKRNTGPKLH